jgi:hypothetical protein
MIASVSVGTTETEVLPVPVGKPYSFIALGNNGTATAYLKLVPDSTPVTTSTGIPLPAGASILCDQDMQKELFHGRVTAIVGSGSTTLSVQAF